jgi:hypothetical protein
MATSIRDSRAHRRRQQRLDKLLEEQERKWEEIIEYETKYRTDE